VGPATASGALARCSVVALALSAVNLLTAQLRLQRAASPQLEGSSVSSSFLFILPCGSHQPGRHRHGAKGAGQSGSAPRRSTSISWRESSRATGPEGRGKQAKDPAARALYPQFCGRWAFIRRWPGLRERRGSHPRAAAFRQGLNRMGRAHRPVMAATGAQVLQQPAGVSGLSPCSWLS